MSIFFSRTLVIASCVLSVWVMAGCASSPPVDSVATVEVAQTAPRTLTQRERDALGSAGVTPDELASGRVVLVSCAVMTDGWWESLAILPPGLQVSVGSILRLKVSDMGSHEIGKVNPANERRPVNRVVGPTNPPLPSGGEARKSLGSRDAMSIELPGTKARYLYVQGGYQIKCVQ